MITYPQDEYELIDLKDVQVGDLGHCDHGPDLWFIVENTSQICDNSIVCIRTKTKYRSPETIEDLLSLKREPGYVLGIPL